MRRLRRAGWASAGADQWTALRDVLRLRDVRRLELAWGLSLARVDFLAAVTGDRISEQAAQDLADERLAATGP